MAEGEVVELAVEVLAADVDGEGASWRVGRGANRMAVVGGDVVDGNWGAGVVEEGDGVGGAGDVTGRVGDWDVDARVLGVAEVVHEVAEENAWHWARGAVQISVDFIQACNADLVSVDATSCTVCGSIGIRIGPENGHIHSGVVSGPVVVSVEKVLHVTGHHLGSDEHAAQSDKVGNCARIGDRQRALLTSGDCSIGEMNTAWVFLGSELVSMIISTHFLKILNRTFGTLTRPESTAILGGWTTGL